MKKTADKLPAEPDTPRELKGLKVDIGSMRSSTNVEIRDPNDPVEKASVDQMLHDLRNTRVLMQGMLNQPENIWRREEMENWLNDRARNDPDYNPAGWDEAGKFMPPGQREVANQKIEKPIRMGKPNSDITAGILHDDQPEIVSAVGQPMNGPPPGVRVHPIKPTKLADDYHGLADSEVPE